MSGFQPYEGPNEIVDRLRAELAAAIKQRDEALELNKEWQQKAATWLATPEAVARLQSYRDLGQQAAKAQNESDALRAELAAAKEAQRDADRYRWLKSGGCYWVEIQSQPSGDYIFRGQAARSIGGSIDNAIDAVLAAQQEGGGA